MKLKTGGYLNRVFDPAEMDVCLRRIAEVARIGLSIMNLDVAPRAVAFTGMSGALVGLQFARLMNCTPALVRKVSDVSHGNRYEGPADVENYLIIDDMICTGHTVRHIVGTMTEVFPASRCLGIALWNDPYARMEYKINDVDVPVFGSTQRPIEGEQE